MRRLATIILALVIIIGLGGGAYAYVANQRQWWPFSTTVGSQVTNTTGFTELIPSDTALYAYLDLSNPTVQARIPSNSELQKNLNTLKGGIQQLGNFIIHSNTSSVFAENPALQQSMERKIVQALEYLGNKKIHISAVTPMATPTNSIATTDIVIGFENASADEARQTTVTLKGFMTENNDHVKVSEITINNTPVTELVSELTVIADPFSDETVSTSTSTPKPTVKQSTYITTLGNNLTILTTNRATIENMIQRAAQPGNNNLKNNTQFISLASKLNGPQLAIMYLNNLKYMEAMSSSMQDAHTAEMYRNMMAAPVYNMSSVIGLTLNDKGIYSESFSSFNDPQVAAAFTSSNASFSNAIPEDTLILAEGNNLTQELGLLLLPILQSLKDDPRLTGNDPLSFIHEFEDSTHISVQNDLAPLFNKNFAVVVHRIDSILTPVALTILTQVEDTTKAEATMAKVATVIGSQVEALTGVNLPSASTENLNGTTIHTYGSLNSADTLFNYGILKNLNALVISSSKNGIGKVLKSMTGAGLTGGHSFEETSKMPELIKNARTFNGRNYIDIRGIADTFLPLIRITMDEEMGAAFDSQVKPYVEAINNLSGYSVMENGVLKSVSQLQLVK